VLGRDAIADSLVFGFDRDQGLAMLTTVKAFTAPPGATAVRYEAVSSKATSGLPTTTERQYDASHDRPPLESVLPGAALGDMPPAPRRLATAQIGDGTFAMHLDLGSAVSQLAEARWTQARLTPVDARIHLVDETASARDVTRAGVGEVALAGQRTPAVTFAPFVDKRFGSNTVDGALGLDFFRPYAVYASWDDRTFYLKPRGDAAATTAARLGRWGAALPACPHPGCVTTELVGTGASVELRVVRDAEAGARALEVYLGVTPAPGRSAAPLVVELPSSAGSLTAALALAYAGATLAVLDVSPFARGCPGPEACMFALGGAPMEASEAPAVAAVAAVAAPRSVTIDKLHRQRGEPAIPPSAAARAAAGGKPIAVAIARLCLTAEGAIDRVTLVKPSGVAAYDDELQRTITATWAFEPYRVDGAAVPVCTQVTFLGR
jgi:hypothetical protein